MNEKVEKLWYLKNLDIFEGVPDDEIMQLAGKVRECTYNKGEMIYSHYESLNCIYVLKRGEVRLFHSKNGKRMVFDVLGPGSLFGGLVFTSDKSTHFAQATHPSRLCIFSEDDFLSILQRKPDIMMRFIKKMTQKIQEYEHSLSMRNDSADELILTELSKLHEKRGRSLFGVWKPSSIHITHEELAELTGLNRVTVTRALKRLKKASKIQIDKNGISIL